MPESLEQQIQQLLAATRTVGGQEGGTGKIPPIVKEAIRMQGPGTRAGAQVGVMQAKGVEARRMAQFKAMELPQAVAKAQETIAVEKAAGQQAAIRKLRTRGWRMVRRGAYVGPQAHQLEKVIAELLTYADAGGAIEADAIKQAIKKNLEADIQKNLSTAKKRFLVKGLDPPADLPDRVGEATGKGRRAIRVMNQGLDTQIHEQAVQRFQASEAAGLEAIGGKQTKQSALERGLADITKATTRGGARAARTAATPGVEKAFARRRMGKGALLGGLAAMLALPMFRHFTGDKEKAQGEMSPQQQFQLAMAMAKRGGTDESLETGRELMNMQRMLRIKQMLEQMAGSQLQPQAGIV